jgi:ATP synthase protein I
MTDNWQADIEKKTRRKLSAQAQKQRSVWFGLGMFGLVGWSIAVPTLIGIMIGIWIDRAWPSRVSWTITLLFVGVVLGCLQAWQWIKRESKHE